MGLTMGERKAVSKQIAGRYRAAGRVQKARILDELCAVTGWHRDHARKALRLALAPQPVAAPRKARDPVYGPEVIAALRKVWAVLDAPSGKRLAPFLGEIVDRLIAHGELEISDEVRYQLVRMSAATIDRRLAADRARWAGPGRSLTKPGSLLKSQIPIRTWADWDDARPGFVEIDLVGHEGGDPAGEFAQSLTVTDIATGWTQVRAVRSKARKWVLPALTAIINSFPFPVLGIDSDNGGEFINHTLVDFCARREITFTRSRPGNSNDNAHVEQKNWTVVRQTVGYHRYTGPAQVDVLNGIYDLLRLQVNFFTPQQKLVSKTRHGATVTKRYDSAQTPFQRLCAHPDADIADTDHLHHLYLTLNPAQIRRDLHALTHALGRMVTTEHPPLHPHHTLPLPGIPPRGNDSPSRAS